MLERDFQRQVIDAARALGWRIQWTYRSNRSPVGFPDLVCVRRGRMVVLELKQEKGKVRPGQQEWVDELDAVPGVRAAIVRPSDYDLVLGWLA